MVRSIVDGVDLTQLDHATEVHDGDPVRQMADDAQVVADEKASQIERLAQIHQQVEDLRLDRDVERSDGLVADDQPRLDRQRPRDADPRPLAAGELMRVATAVGRIETDLTEDLRDILRRIAARDQAVGDRCLVVSVIFLTLFGLIEEPRARDWIGSLMYRDKRERYLDVTDRIVNTTSRYMLGNLVISLVCGTVYGVTAVILDLPYPLALALIAAALDLIPSIGATIAGIIISLVALSVSVEALIVFAIVMLVYQQIENYVLQPTIIGRAARVSGFTVLVSVLVFGALFGFIGAIIAVPIAAALQILVEELTAGRRARIEAANTAERQLA